MFTSSEPSSAINSITLVNGEFKIDPTTGETKIKTSLMYSNKESKITFGTCSAQESLFGLETMEAFEKFTELVEQDFARLVLEGGVHSKIPGQIGGQVSAESGEGLKPKGIGGR